MDSIKAILNQASIKLSVLVVLIVVALVAGRCATNAIKQAAIDDAEIKMHQELADSLVKVNEVHQQQIAILLKQRDSILIEGHSAINKVKTATSIKPKKIEIVSDSSGVVDTLITIKKSDFDAIVTSARELTDRYTILEAADTELINIQNYVIADWAKVHAQDIAIIETQRHEIKQLKIARLADKFKTGGFLIVAGAVLLLVHK